MSQARFLQRYVEVCRGYLKAAEEAEEGTRRGSYASVGPEWKIQEVSRVGAQGVTSKSKRLAREMPDLHTGGLRVDSGVARSRKGAQAGQRVDRRGTYASVGPECEIQEVSRVGAQGVTSKSKLLAREMPDLHTGGLRADPGVARSRKGAQAVRRVDRRGSYASVGPG